jgi:hypothetical protein
VEGAEELTKQVVADGRGESDARYVLARNQSLKGQGFDEDEKDLGMRKAIIES